MPDQEYAPGTSTKAGYTYRCLNCRIIMLESERRWYGDATHTWGDYCKACEDLLMYGYVAPVKPFVLNVPQK